MVNDGWKVRVVSDPSSTGLDIYIFREAHGERLEVMVDMSGDNGAVCETIPMGIRMKPAMRLHWHCEQLLQAISDGLFDFGIKPTQAPVLKNEMTATKEHLQDMRDIVAHTLKLPTKESEKSAG